MVRCGLLRWAGLRWAGPGIVIHCPAVPGQAPFYNATSNTKSGVVYVLNTTLVEFDEAETNCKINGGHLASYASWSEQKEVRLPLMILLLISAAYRGM
jgi:hypothetical protein